MSSLLDLETQSKNMKDAVERSIQDAFPIEGNARRIELTRVWTGTEKDASDFAAQKSAKLKGRSYATPVYAALKMVDKSTGKVLDKVTRIKLAELPVITPRNSFIVKGNEYQVTHQLRLRPGVYTQEGADGKLSSQVNLSKGRNFKVWIDPREGLFKVNIGTSNVKLYPLLKDLGVSDNAMKDAWGSQIWSSNKEDSSGVMDTEINKLYKNLFYKSTPLNKDEAVSRVTDYFKENTKIDKDTTEFTLGKPHSNVNPRMLMDVSKKLLGVSRGEQDEDDRNHLGFKTLHSVDDFLSERLNKMSGKIVRDLSRHIDNIAKKSISEIISREAFHKPIESLFTQTQLSSTPEQINPLHMIAGMQKTTVLGEGGITDKALTPKARGVHSSHLGLLDPVQTPESHAVGAMFRLPVAARKEGSKLKALLFSPSGEKSTKSAREMHDLYVAFPGQFERDPKAKSGKFKPPDGLVTVQHKGEIKEVDAKKVDQILSTPRGMFGLSVNMIPFLDSDSGNRTLTASRMQEQALPLESREQPLVQAETTTGNSYENTVAEAFQFATIAPQDGTITKIKDDGSVYLRPKGKQRSIKLNTYKDFPLNAKHFINSDLKVKVGDKVSKGGVIADTNYTKGGKLALGTNLRVGYVPYRGYNYEDGVVISESAAKKMTSLHMYKEEAKSDNDTVMNKSKFLARFPSKFTSEQLAKLDEDGVVKPGQILEEGDPVMLVMSKTTARPEDGVLRSINKSLVRPFRDVSVVWNKTVPGQVSDVSKPGKRAEVHVKTKEPAVIGDKLAGRHGNKGIITKILPDGEMPHTADGNHTEVLMNPHGVPSRMNIGQMLETAVGKVAAKRGKPVLIKNFQKGSNIARVQSLLKSEGLKATEELFDGYDGKSIGDVSVGQQFIMKLDHSVAKKFHARDTGGYTADEAPGKGGEGGAQSIDPLLFYSLISHGAKENLHEMATVKGTKNDEFWRAYQMGQRLPTPKPTFAFEKFTSMMKGLGVNVDKKGHNFSLIPMTDDDIGKMSAGEVQNGKLFKTRGVSGLAEETGGLFDPKVTGGSSGNKWSHISLAEPMPNPLFEDAIKTTLGIKQKEFDGLLQGKLAVGVGGVLTPVKDAGEGAMTGGRAFKSMLANIDMDARIKELRKDAVGTKGQKLNTFNKEIRYLEALKKNGLDPTVYMSNKIPVLPPKFRPVYLADNGQLITSDVNLLYKDLMLSNEAFRDKKELGFPAESLGETAMHLYNQQRLLSGLGGEATTFPGARTPKGIVKTISGMSSPKTGFFQSKLVRRRQDMSARSTVIPEPSLGVDEIGLPKKMLQTMYRKPLVRRLVKIGYTPLQAQKEIDKNSLVSQRAMELEVEARPVLVNRAPSLHKFSMMAFKPKVTDGKAIKIHPLVVKGFGMDFDGDTAAVHVPVTDAATKEALKMLPTNNLFNPGTGDMMVMPGQEAVLGLYRLTEKGKNTRRKFKNFAEAKAAVSKGEITATDTVTIGDTKTSVGRYTVNLVLPKEIRDFDAVFNKKHIGNMLTSSASVAPHDFGSIADGLKDIGNEHAYRVGATINLDDLDPMSKQRDELFRKIQPKINNLNKQISQARSASVRQELNNKKIEMYSGLTKKIDQGIRSGMSNNNNVKRMADSGARGNYAQIRQMVSAPVMLTDTDGVPIPVPVKKSYAEGLDPAGYWTQSFGARTGAVDKSLQTAIPGYFQKRLINTMIDTTITMPDCGTTQGVEKELGDEDTEGRYTPAVRYGLARNSLVTSRVVAVYRRHKQKTIKVRSPLTCEAKDGICAKCFGRREHGKDSSLGDNIGSISAQSIAEPATQMQMKTFHTGGVAEGGVGSGLKSGFERILQLTELPSRIKGAATLAELDGKVDSITPAPAGGNFVFVNNKEHFVPSRLNLSVKQGDKVSKGGRISGGEINPHDLLRLKGIESTQGYLTGELKKEYHNQGMRLRSNVLETAVRSLTNLTRVTDPGDSDDHAPGDYVSLAKIRAKIRGGSNIQHTPELKGINQAPLYGNEDWMSQLNFQNLKKTVMNAATKNWSSSIHGTNPVASWVYGAEFGKSEQAGTY